MPPPVYPGRDHYPPHPLVCIPEHYSHHHRHCTFGFGFFSSSVLCPDYYAVPGYYAVPSYYAVPTVIPDTVVVQQPVVVATPMYQGGTVVTGTQDGPAGVVVPDQTSAGSTQSVVTTPPPSPQSSTEAAQAPAGTPQTPASSAQPPGSPVNSKVGEQLYQMMVDGTKAFSAGDYDAAAKYFLQVTMQDPENPDAALAYAVGRFATGDYTISAVAIRRGVRRYPEVVNTSFDIRERYSKPEDFERHVKALEAYLNEHPENLDAIIVLGFVQHFSAEREMAVRTFEEVKRRSPAEAELADIFIKAKSLEEIRKLEEAQQQQDGATTQPASGSVDGVNSAPAAQPEAPVSGGPLPATAQPQTIVTPSPTAPDLFSDSAPVNVAGAQAPSQANPVPQATQTPNPGVLDVVKPGKP